MATLPASTHPTARDPGNLWYVLIVATCLAILLAGYWVLQPTLYCGYVYDDHVTVLDPALKPLSLELLARLFSGIHMQDYYPVFYASLAIDRYLWAGKPFGLHLTNLVLHLINVLLVYALAVRLVRRTAQRDDGSWRLGAWGIATVAALLFAVHPNHVEPVAWVSGRKVLFAAMWGLAAVHLYLFALRDGRRHLLGQIGAVACTALACMSNVYAVVVPAFIVLTDRLCSDRGWLKAGWVSWPHGVVAAGAVVAKVTSRSGGVDRESPFSGWLDWAGTVLSVYGKNVVSLLSPTRRNILYPNEIVSSPASGWALLGLFMVIVLVLFIRAGRQRPLLWFAAWWWLLALVPTTQLARHHILRADRYLYIPGVGACLLAGLATVGLWRWAVRSRWRLIPASLVSILACSLASGLSLSSRFRTTDWFDDETLWRASIEVDEANPDAHHSLGCMLMRKGKLEDALQHLRRSIELNPRHVDAHNTLSVLMLKLDRPEQAVENGRLAVEIRPELAEAKFNLARALMAADHYGLALDQWQRGLEQKPDDLGARFYLAQTLLKLGRSQQAIEAYRRVLRAEPDYAQARLGLARAKQQIDQVDGAEAELRQLLSDTPDHPEARALLGDLMLRRKSYDAAAKQYRQAIAAQEDYLPARIALAWLLATCPDPDLRDGKQAVALLEPYVADGTGTDNLPLLRALAAAYAETGRFEKAVETEAKATEQARRSGRTDLAEACHRRLTAYRAGKTVRSSDAAAVRTPATTSQPAREP